MIWCDKEVNRSNYRAPLVELWFLFKHWVLKCSSKAREIQYLQQRILPRRREQHWRREWRKKGHFGSQKPASYLESGILAGLWDCVISLTSRFIFSLHFAWTYVICRMDKWITAPIPNRLLGLEKTSGQSVIVNQWSYVTNRCISVMSML